MRCETATPLQNRRDGVYPGLSLSPYKPEAQASECAEIARLRIEFVWNSLRGVHPDSRIIPANRRKLRTVEYHEQASLDTSRTAQ